MGVAASLGSLALTSGTLAMGANGLFVAGGITQAGGRITSTGTITLNGAAAQGVDFTNSTVTNLVVNNTSLLNPAVTLNGPATLTVGGVFTHTAGI